MPLGDRKCGEQLNAKRCVSTVKADQPKACTTRYRLAVMVTQVCSCTFAVVSHMPSQTLSHELAKHTHMDHTRNSPHGGWPVVTHRRPPTSLTERPNKHIARGTFVPRNFCPRCECYPTVCKCSPSDLQAYCPCDCSYDTGATAFAQQFFASEMPITSLTASA